MQFHRKVSGKIFPYPALFYASAGLSGSKRENATQIFPSAIAHLSNQIFP
jgi:hypothetical protein